MKQRHYSIRSFHSKLPLLIAAVFLSCITILAGCSEPAASSSVPSDVPSAEPLPSVSVEASADAETSPALSENGDLGRVLVVYFSGSGNTRAVAEAAAAELDADIFEIIPEEPYTEDDLDWTNEDSRVNAEHEDASQQDVPLQQTIPDDFDAYDTVVLGYPIWWGNAAWPVNTFITGNDFTGKTIIPFCTSTSTGIEQSEEVLEELAGTGTWREGHRFEASPSSADDVSSWIDTL